MKSPKNSRNKLINPAKPTNKTLRKKLNTNAKFVEQFFKNAKKSGLEPELASNASKSIASKVKGKPVPTKRSVRRGGAGLGGAFGIKNK